MLMNIKFSFYLVQLYCVKNLSIKNALMENFTLLRVLPSIWSSLQTMEKNTMPNIQFLLRRRAYMYKIAICLRQ